MATQRTNIYIEGVALDLDKNIDIDLTYSISDISDFEKRTTTFSKTVVIPGTAHNSFLLGNYFDFNIQNSYSNSLDNVGVNFNSLKKAFCKVTVDNVEVFAGVLRLLEITSKNGEIQYQCALFGSLGGLFSTIGDKLLTDLDLSDFDQTYNLPTIQGSWVRDDYIYALGNYGSFWLGLQENFNVENFRPSIFAKELFDRIIASAGYTYNPSFWENDNLDKIVVMNNEERLSIYLSSLGSAFFGEQTIGNSYTSLVFVDSDPSYCDFELDGLGNYNIINRSGVDIKTKISGFIRWSRAIATPDVLRIKIGSSDFAINISGTSGEFQFEMEVLLITNINYPVFLKVDTYTIDIELASYLQVFNFDSTTKIPSIYGKNIGGKSFVPSGIKQADFMKSIINLLNLYIVQNKDDEFNLEFIPYSDFYLNENIDWTEKKDLNNGFSIKPSNSFLPKTISFKYKADNDYYSKLYNNKYNLSFGSKLYETQNDFSKEIKSTELIFSLVPSTLVNVDMALPAMFDINDSGGYKAVATNPKLVFYGGMKDCTNYKIYSLGTLLDATNTQYPYFGHLYDYETAGAGDLWDLAFEAPKEVYIPVNIYPQNNLFSKYYSGFVDAQDNKDSKLLTLYFLLNTVDITDLDFRKYYKVDNGLYYLNKVDGYNPLGNDLTKVELIRIA